MHSLNQVPTLAQSPRGCYAIIERCVAGPDPEALNGEGPSFPEGLVRRVPGSTTGEEVAHVHRLPCVSSYVDVGVCSVCCCSYVRWLSDGNCACW